jgi:hypothetical protein
MEKRRRVLQAGVIGACSVFAGCTSTVNRFVGGQSTGGEEIPDAVFTFDYESAAQELRVTFKDGDQPMAGALQIRSSRGAQVRWNELGSTSVTESSRLSEGATATIGPSIVNWGEPVTVDERIKLVYRPNSNSPATIAEFDVETAVTVTAEPTSDSADRSTPSETRTSTSSGGKLTVFEDTFANSNYENAWTVSATDDEQIREEDTYLLHSSPKEYNEGGDMRSIESFTADGVQRIVVEQRTRTPDYWGYGFGVTDGDVEIDLREHRWQANDSLKLEGGTDGNRTIETATTSTEILRYSLTVDFDSSTITQVTRNGETYETDYDFSDEFDNSYDIHLGEGRGHEVEYHSVRIEKAETDDTEQQVTFPVELEENVRGGLAAIEDRIYAIIDGDPNYIARIDPYAEEVDKKIDISHDVGSGMTYDGSDLWIVDFNSDDVVRFDPTTGAESVEFQSSGDPAGVGFGGRSLWIGDIFSNRIYEYGRDGNEKSQFPIGSETTNAAGVAYHEDELWVMDKDGTVYVYTTDGNVADQRSVFSGLSGAAIDSSQWGVIAQDADGNIDRVQM